MIKPPRRDRTAEGETSCGGLNLSETLIAEANRWKGVPFKHRGRDRRGVDCINLAIAIYKAAGIDVPEVWLNYERQWWLRDPGLLVRSIEPYAKRNIGKPRPGDILVLTLDRLPTHCGIYLGRIDDHDKRAFVTVLYRHNVNIYCLDHRYWRDRLAASYRLGAVEQTERRVECQRERR